MKINHIKIKYFAILIALPLLMSGCTNKSGASMGFFSATAPVIAILQDDLFLGTAVGYMDRTGTIDITSQVNPSLKCIGNFRYTGSKIGIGRMTCNDGNIADFQFNGLSTLSGYGFGRSNRGGVSFTFGLTPEEAAQYLKMPSNKKLEKNSEGKTILI
jgi:hypothetical protein